ELLRVRISVLLHGSLAPLYTGCGRNTITAAQNLGIKRKIFGQMFRKRSMCQGYVRCAISTHTSVSSATHQADRRGARSMGRNQAAGRPPQSHLDGMENAN